MSFDAVTAPFFIFAVATAAAANLSSVTASISRCSVSTDSGMSFVLPTASSAMMSVVTAPLLIWTVSTESGASSWEFCPSCVCGGTSGSGKSSTTSSVNIFLRPATFIWLEKFCALKESGYCHNVWRFVSCGNKCDCDLVCLTHPILLILFVRIAGFYREHRFCFSDFVETFRPIFHHCFEPIAAFLQPVVDLD